MERLDRIEPPGQLVSFLTDPLLQKYVELKPSPAVSARIGLWLATCLEDQISCAALAAEDPIFLAELLDGLLQHARYTKVCASHKRRSYHTHIILDSFAYCTGLPKGVPCNLERP